jgi:hypothetical protein
MNKINKALQIAGRGGGKVIVVDSANPEADPLVVMSLKEYEENTAPKRENNVKVGDLTEQQLIDKINRDIALWKSENPGQEDLEEIEEEDDDIVEENMYYYPDESLLISRDFEEEEDDEEEDMPMPDEEESLFEKFAREEERQREKSGSGWEIPFEVKRNADEIQE